MYVLVGNAKSIFGKKLGSKIDSFQEVIRFNEGIYRMKTNIEDFGSKTTIHCVNHLEIQHLDKTKKTLITYGRKKPDPKYLNDVIPKRFTKIQLEKYDYPEYQWFSTGMITILYLLFYKNEPVIYLANFDFCKNDAVDIVGYKIQRYHHDWKKEETIVHDLIDQKRIIILD